MTPQEKELQEAAIRFAKANKKPIARELTDRKRFPAESDPVSVFMAGSPGAGKTEASIELISLFSDTPILRIDADELRERFEGYDGTNAWLFQYPASILVEKVLDMALEYRQSFLLDGTLSNLDKAVSNVERSLGRGRFVQILYVYQNPMLAWQFVQARESQEGRRILPEHFVEQYFAARDVVNALKLKFGKEVHVDLLLKHIDNSNRLYKAGVDKIDYHIPERYTRASLAEALGLTNGAIK
ncbi:MULTISPECIES: zeta toxin family protein [Pseudomonas]|uniref:Zeta toxin family protein n=1 Tax=Pseudomonas luteola TaxID=47886 RepID=A0ABS0FPJ1_PSELU|nr:MULTISPECIES: zeta toxin family protein [Pseudomonas]MBF8642298.1 zeta toxin family protein [Pseudomonas zeshuii]RRW48319.1 Zeta toxin [Pseudomonas luteola]SHJ23720.1 Zeta toxin [Pseudomonas zeshuii]